MGRSTREQAEENCLRILEHAKAALRSGGANAVTISDLMASTGLTQGGFYNHFASKDALMVAACVANFSDAAQDWQSAALPPAQSTGGAFDRLVTNYFVPRPQEQSCPIVAMVQDAASARVSTALLEAYREGVKRLLATFLEVSRADHSRSLTDAQLRLAFAAMVGANALAQATKDDEWLRSVRHALTELQP